MRYIYFWRNNGIFNHFNLLKIRTSGTLQYCCKDFALRNSMQQSSKCLSQNTMGRLKANYYLHKKENTIFKWRQLNIQVQSTVCTANLIRQTSSLRFSKLLEDLDKTQPAAHTYTSINNVIFFVFHLISFCLLYFLSFVLPCLFRLMTTNCLPHSTFYPSAHSFQACGYQPPLIPANGLQNVPFSYTFLFLSWIVALLQIKHLVYILC